jgi:hypothetical protein
LSGACSNSTQGEINHIKFLVEKFFAKDNFRDQGADDRIIQTKQIPWL